MKKAIAIICLCALIGGGLWYANRPVSEILAPERLEAQLASGGMVLLGDTVYETESGCDLSQFVDISRWDLEKPGDVGKRILTVQLGDEYEMAFYENGWIKAYDGYAGWHVRGTVWYKVTEQDLEEMIEYIQTNGSLKEPLLGPESWFVLHD